MASSAAPSGFLLILNVIKDRSGAQEDTKNLTTVFKKMGAEVLERHDPTGKDVRKIMGEMKEILSSKDYLYVAVAYLSHGGEDDLVKASDGEIIKAQKSILIPLCNIQSLDGKLKWLIMQTCRGPYDFVKQTTEGPVALIKYPNYCAKFFATSQGMKAYRTAENGSYFIRALCNRLESEYKDKDIISIMEGTILDVQESCNADPNRPYVQKPDCETNFDNKRFFVISGFQDKN